MSVSSDYFIGITTWNSAQFLSLCLDSLRHTAPGAEIAVLDNESVDETVQIAKSHGARVIVRRCSQPDALNILATSSKRKFTLLIHADVVMLSPLWPQLVADGFTGNVALVSPEDIGCGPYTRPWGKGKPESSFMCFETRNFHRLRTRLWKRRFRIPYFTRAVDFYGDHITYNLPDRLAGAGLEWTPMRVHVSNLLPEPYYAPDFEVRHWSPELGALDYGLGNFYSIDGVVTHYHNWYDRRVDQTRAFAPQATLEMNGDGVPVAFLKAYTERFISDYKSGRVRIPFVAK